MGQSLAESLPAARRLFDRAHDVLGYDLASLCFEGPAEKLSSTVHSQPALFVTSLAALEQVKQEQPELPSTCAATAGLSLGEYTALVFAGAMDFETGLTIVKARGEAMQAAADAAASGMVSILGLEAEPLASLCNAARVDGGTLHPANWLCPGNTAVSGDRASCDQLIKLAPQHEAKAMPLDVAGAFHTRLMEPAVQPLRAALNAASIRSPQIPVVSNVDAQNHEDPEEIRDLLVQQVVSPVLWHKSMEALVSFGIGQFYELGSGRVLRGLLRRIDRKLACDNFSC